MRTKKSNHFDAQQDRELDKKLAIYSERLMSNAKWVRLISLLVENIELVKKVQFKSIRKEKVGELFFEDLSYGFDFWDFGIEGNNSLGGWLVFKEIEYLLFPKMIEENTGTTQDLIQIEDLINSIGEFCLERDGNQMILHCYK